MSKRSDIRMYVEHLFMGRTLDAETIELKEEIYGNLVARFDDYIAQGLSEDEAYRRTCEAVTSVDDVLGEKNADAEKVTAATPGTAEKDAGGASVETSTETVVMPAATEQPPETPPDPQEATDKPKKRWSKGKIAAVVAVAVVGVLLVVGIAQALVGGALFNRAFVSTTSSSVPVTDTTTTEGTGTQGQTTQNTQTTQTENVTDSGITAAPTGSGELWSEVSAHSCDDLAAYANTSLSDTSAIEALAGSLPLGSYVSGVTADVSARTATLTYTYPHDRDHLAHDDDHVDMALVYDAAAIMCTVPDLDTLVIDELEPDDGTYDRDRQVFERSTLEALLGVTLDEGCLATDSWESLRNQLMTERVYDRAWDLADHD